jgi:hypothetical protein
MKQDKYLTYKEYLSSCEETISRLALSIPLSHNLILLFKLVAQRIKFDDLQARITGAVAEVRPDILRRIWEVIYYR